MASVGPTLGSELFKNSLIALSLALLGIIAYLTFRFKFDYALAAILGLVHDAVFVRADAARGFLRTREAGGCNDNLPDAWNSPCERW